MSLFKKIRRLICRHRSDCFYWLAVEGIYELNKCVKCGLETTVNLVTYKPQVELNIFDAFTKRNEESK